MTCTYFYYSPLSEVVCTYFFRFLHFLVYRNAGDPVVKFSPRLHMVSSTFCIQIQIQSIQLLFLFLLAIRPPTYKISITCRFLQMKGLQDFLRLPKKFFPFQSESSLLCKKFMEAIWVWKKLEENLRYRRWSQKCQYDKCKRHKNSNIAPDAKFWTQKWFSLHIFHSWCMIYDPIW